jgi:surface polysaccharide O-acyltransferase-like enzyme
MPSDTTPLAIPHSSSPKEGDTRPPGSPSGAAARAERRFDIDLIRLICCSAVMVKHVAGAFIGAVERDESNGASTYWAGMIADAANQYAVPMFFAMAGWAVLVGAPPRDGAHMWQRVVRNGTPLFVWTAAYIAWAWYQEANTRPTSEIAVDSLFGTVQPAYHLWFLYAYLPIVMMLGFAMLIRSGQRPYGLGAVLLVVACLPQLLGTVSELTDWRQPAVTWGFATYSVIYALGGAMLFALPRRLPAWGRRLLIPVVLLAMAGCVWWDTQVHYVIANGHPFVAVLTIGLLLLLARIPVSERWRPVVTRLSGAAMGAYMVHVFFVEELVKRWVSADYGPLEAVSMLVAMVAMTMVLSYSVSLLWGRLNLRRWLG